MSEQVFGGNWTEVKLACLSAYLREYQTIFTKSRASYYKTWYVDAFAGTGQRRRRRLPNGSIFETPLEGDRNNDFQAGSAKIALSVRPPFDRYLFIEKSRDKAAELLELIEAQSAEIEGRCVVHSMDANVALQQWCSQRNWQRERAVVFLDPFGMQVDWETVQMLGATEAVDLWYLFPVVSRLLKKDGDIDTRWQDRLDRLFGTPDWRTRFYRTRSFEGLFGEDEETFRDATTENIKFFTEERLRTCFYQVAPSKVLRNSMNGPLFALCFAAANKKGAPIAIRIAKNILKG